MKLKDLYNAIEELNREHYHYHLNAFSRDVTHVLEYNKKMKLWEYYLLDERGGKGNILTFITEEEACKYVLNNAIEVIKNLTNPWLDAIGQKYEAMG